jgi:hypothetical protein
MTYKITTRDGTIFIVDEVDVRLITAYLVLLGHPPMTTELSDGTSTDVISRSVGRIYDPD